MRTAGVLRQFTRRRTGVGSAGLSLRSQRFARQPLQSLQRPSPPCQPFVRNMLSSMNESLHVTNLAPASYSLWNKIARLVGSQEKSADKILSLDTSFSRDLEYTLSDMDEVLTKIEKAFGISEIPATRGVQLQTLRDVFEYVSLSIVACTRTRDVDSVFKNNPKPTLWDMRNYMRYMEKNTIWDDLKSYERRQILDYIDRFVQEDSPSPVESDDVVPVYFTHNEVSEMVGALHVQQIYENELLKTAGATKDTPKSEIPKMLENIVIDNTYRKRLGYDENTPNYEIQAHALSMKAVSEFGVDQSIVVTEDEVIAALAEMGLPANATYDAIIVKRKEEFDAHMNYKKVSKAMLETAIHPRGDKPDPKMLLEIARGYLTEDERKIQEKWVDENLFKNLDFMKCNNQLNLYKAYVAGEVPKIWFDKYYGKHEEVCVDHLKNSKRAKKHKKKMDKVYQYVVTKLEKEGLMDSELKKEFENINLSNQRYSV